MRPQRNLLLVGMIPHRKRFLWEWIKKIWQIKQSSFFDCKTEKEEMTLQSEMKSGHSRSVNMIRFSKFGNFMASCSDDCNVIIWEKKMRPIVFGKPELHLKWGEKKFLSCHKKQTQAWSIFDIMEPRRGENNIRRIWQPGHPLGFPNWKRYPGIWKLRVPNKLSILWTHN